MLCCTKKLPEAFLVKHIDYFNVGYIFMHQDVSDEFICKYADKVDWSNFISLYIFGNRYMTKMSSKYITRLVN